MKADEAAGLIENQKEEGPLPAARRGPHCFPRDAAFDHQPRREQRGQGGGQQQRPGLQLFQFLPGQEHAADEFCARRRPSRTGVWDRTIPRCRRRRRRLWKASSPSTIARVTRYESEPEPAKARRNSWLRAGIREKRDHALKQDPYFDYAEALLQIAIVLISISIVASQRWLAWFGGALGGVGALLMLNGFHLLIEIPWLA